MRILTVIVAIAWTSTVHAQCYLHPFAESVQGVQQIGLAMQETGSVEGEDTGDGKSSKAAVLMSLALPGAGEFYLGAKKRAAIFLSLDAITWLGFFTWRDKGNNIKAEFRTYADQYWDEVRYRAWQDFNQDPDNSPPFNETETLPDRQTGDVQQYYEMIGKYDQFVFGWDDIRDVAFTTQNGEVLSNQRVDYEDQRNESNKFLKRASVLTGFAVLNRITSAIHASVYARNRSRKASSVRLWVGAEPWNTRGRSVLALNASF